MKTKTHNLFNIGILTAIGSLFVNPIASLISAGILSMTGNAIIDDFGHKKNNYGIEVRTYKTHSILRATIYGFLPAVILFFIVIHLNYFDKFIPLDRFISHKPYWILIQGLFVGGLHLLMDVITEGGIFVKKRGRFQRFAIAHIKYNNVFWNTFFQIVGIAILILTFYVNKGAFYGFNYR